MGKRNYADRIRPPEPSAAQLAELAPLHAQARELSEELKGLATQILAEYETLQDIAEIETPNGGRDVKYHFMSGDPILFSNPSHSIGNISKRAPDTAMQWFSDMVGNQFASMRVKFQDKNANYENSLAAREAKVADMISRGLRTHLKNLPPIPDDASVLDAMPRNKAILEKKTQFIDSLIAKVKPLKYHTLTHPIDGSTPNLFDETLHHIAYAIAHTYDSTVRYEDRPIAIPEAGRADYDAMKQKIESIKPMADLFAAKLEALNNTYKAMEPHLPEGPAKDQQQSGCQGRADGKITPPHASRRVRTHDGGGGSASEGSAA